MSAITLAEMRERLGLGPEVSDEVVVQRWAEYQAGPAEAEPPVTLARAKAHLKVEHDDEDDLIQLYLDAAIAHIDGPSGWLGRSITRQVLVEYMDGLDCSMIRLPYPPVVSVQSIELRAADGTWSTLDTSLWEFDYDSGMLMRMPGQFWPAPGVDRRGIRISYTAGYDEAPKPIASAILLMTADLYRQRETFTKGSSASVAKVPMSTTVETLLEPFRVYR